MNDIRPNQPAPGDAADVAEEYGFELEAARNHLDAQLPDLVYLLPYLLSREVSRSQVQGLLEQACRRLRALRESHDEVASAAAGTEIESPLQAARGYLDCGAKLSLIEADQAYERLYRDCIDRQRPACLAARIRAQQALTAAVMVDYRHAAALYAEAAAAAEGDFALARRYLLGQASMLSDQGREFIDVDALRAAIDLYREALLPLTPRDERADDWATLQNGLGNTLGILGQRQRGTRLLEEAIAAFEHALTRRDRERLPFAWAETQNNLGNALGILGQRQHDEEMLEKAIAAFESALEVRSSEQTPGDWATTQSNLAAVLQTLGGQRKDTRMLKRSVDAYKALLTVWTSERLPLAWGATMNNLGSALRMLGELRKGPRTLEQSVAAFNAALSVRTRERVPRDWAMTQNNLGAALQVLGERTDDALALGRSVAAYREALREWTREREPMSWGMAMANLGVARRKLAEHNEDIDIARRAAADLKMAVDVFRGASHARLTELAEEQLSLARKLVGSLQPAKRA